MVGYALLLWGQTVLSLVVLGLAGGWALALFRPNKPYLWLAAPLTGILLLLSLMAPLNCVCRLSLPACLLLSLGLLALPGVFHCVRALRRDGPPRGWKLALGAALVVSAWCTWASNETSIRRREPTLCIREGTDGFGYSLLADWILQHNQEWPVWSPRRPCEAFIYHIYTREHRWGAFLFAASAAWVRGTGALFSYDWASGVALAAGILALAGAFASDRRCFLLLLAAGSVSLWYAVSRTGFLGKTLAYPGCMLLAAVFFAAWERLTLSRLVVAGLLGAGVGLCHNPLTTASVLGLVFGATLAAAVALWLLGWVEQPRLACVRNRLLSGLVLYAVMAGPLLFLFWSPALTVPVQPMDWSLLWPTSLDLDNNAILFKDLPLTAWLIRSALVLQAVFLVLAFRERTVQGTSLLLAAGGILLAARVLDRKEIYQFQGLLFPLTVLGAVLVLERQRQLGRGRPWRWATLTLAMGLVALRLPQFAHSCERYGRIAADGPFCFAQSEVDAVVRLVGDRTVDVSGPGLYDGFVLLVEFGRRNVAVQFREPTWTAVVGIGWKVPAFPRRADFTLGLPRGWVSPRSVRFAGSHYRLTEDGHDLAFLQVQAPHGVLPDELARPSIWLGQAPASILMYNGTGHTVTTAFRAEGHLGPCNPGLPVRTLRYAFNGVTGSQVLISPKAWGANIPLEVPPGTHPLRLSIEEKAVIFPYPGDSRDLGLLLTNFRLEESTPPDQTAARRE